MYTWIAAMKNSHIHTWPGLRVHAVKKYLPESTAMVKEHMKETSKGIPSMQLQLKKQYQKADTHTNYMNP